MAIVTVGIDLAKNVFAVHGVDETGKAVLVRPEVPRAKLIELIANLPACLSSRKAARATCALKVGVCVRRVRRADFLTIKNSFSPDQSRPGFMPGVSTYSAVQICGATSLERESIKG